MIKKILELFTARCFAQQGFTSLTPKAGMDEVRVEYNRFMTKNGVVRPMSSNKSDSTDLTGSLLVATPALLDPNFRRTIIFLSRHEIKEGAFGVILNRPSGRTLGELTESPENLLKVPVFQGGPVEQQQLLLARILFMEGSARFESFGQSDTGTRDGETTAELSDNRGLRAFAGYAGWSAGQLEAEIREKSWLILPPDARLLREVRTAEEGLSSWRGIMRELGPWYRLLAEAPDDLSLN